MSDWFDEEVHNKVPHVVVSNTMDLFQGRTLEALKRPGFITQNRCFPRNIRFRFLNQNGVANRADIFSRQY